MVADTEGARPLGALGRRARRQPGWLGLLGNAALLILVATGLAVAGLYFAGVLPAPISRRRRSRSFALAAIIGVAAAAWRTGCMPRSAGRVDILSQALDASPDAQLILAPDGRIAYANTAFHDLFPQSDEPPLARIAAGARRCRIDGRFRPAAQPRGGRRARDRRAAAARFARRAPPAGSTSRSTRSPAGRATASGTSRTSPPAMRWRR